MKPRRHIKALDVALIVVAAVFLAFTTAMIVIFWRFQMVPDGLVAGFYASCGIEVVMAAWIEVAKKKAEPRQKEEDTYDH